MNRLFKLQQGISLIETIIAISILAVVMVAASAAFTSINKGQAKNRVTTHTNQAARLAMDQLIKDAKVANGAKLPDNQTGRVYPPFMVFKGGAHQNTSFDTSKDVLVITNTDKAGKVTFKAYGTKSIGTRQAIVMVSGSDFPPDKITSLAEEVTPNDVDVVDLTMHVTPDQASATSRNWYMWAPIQDQSGDGKITYPEAQADYQSKYLPLLSDYVMRPAQQPMLYIDSLSLRSVESISNTDTTLKANITVKTAVSSRDYDYDR